MPYTLDELKQLRKQAQTVEKLLKEENAAKKKATSEHTRQWGGATGGVGSSAGRDIHRVSSTAPKTNPYTYTGSTGTTSKTGLGAAPRTSPYTTSPYTPSTSRATTAGTYAESTGTAPKVNTYLPSTGAAAYTAASGTGYEYGSAGYGTGIVGTVGTVGTPGAARMTGFGNTASAAARTVRPMDRAPSKINVNGGNNTPSWGSAGASGVSGLAGTPGLASAPGVSGGTSRTMRPMDRAPSKINVNGGNNTPSWGSAGASGASGVTGTPGLASTPGASGGTSRTVRPMDRAPSKVIGGNGAPSWGSAGASGVSGLAGTSGLASTPGASGGTSRTVRPMDRAPSKVIGGNGAPSWVSAGASGVSGLVGTPGLASAPGASGATSRTVRPMDRAPSKVLGQTEDEEKEDEEKEQQQKKAVQSFMQRLENPQIYDIMETERRGMEYGKELLDKELKELLDKGLLDEELLDKERKELLDKEDKWLQEQARKLDDLRLWVKREKRSPELMRDMHAVYKDDPDSWQVIMGNMSPKEWVQKRQYEQRQAQREMAQRTEALKKQPEELVQTANQQELGQYDKLKSLDEWCVSHQLLERKEGEPATMRAPDQDPAVPDFSNDYVPTYEPLLIPETTVGGRKYEPHELNLTEELQRHIYNMCKLSGVDYYLVLAIIAHETGSNQYEPNETYPQIKGLMQFNTDFLDNYIPHEKPLDPGKKTDYYLDPEGDYPAVKKVCDYAQENDANMYDLFDPLTACAYGIATFYAHYQNVGTIEGALERYTGGGYSVDEIIEYRNLLAEKDGQTRW